MFGAGAAVYSELVPLTARGGKDTSGGVEPLAERSWRRDDGLGLGRCCFTRRFLPLGDAGRVREEQVGWIDLVLLFLTECGAHKISV